MQSANHTAVYTGSVETESGVIKAYIINYGNVSFKRAEYAPFNIPAIAGTKVNVTYKGE